MKRFVEGVDRGQSTLFPECLENWVVEDNAVRVIDVFVDRLDLAELRFGGVDPEATGRPSYHPSVLLKLYIYGYLNRAQSSRRLASRRLWVCGVDHEAPGRPSYHPSVLLKLYIYGYLNRVQSSRRLEREARRNVEVMWLTGRLVPDHKTIADFRKDNGKAIGKVCARFVELCREMGLL